MKFPTVSAGAGMPGMILGLRNAEEEARSREARERAVRMDNMLGMGGLGLKLAGLGAGLHTAGKERQLKRDLAKEKGEQEAALEWLRQQGASDLQAGLIQGQKDVISHRTPEMIEREKARQAGLVETDKLRSQSAMTLMDRRAALDAIADTQARLSDLARRKLDFQAGKVDENRRYAEGRLGEARKEAHDIRKIRETTKGQKDIYAAERAATPTPQAAAAIEGAVETNNAQLEMVTALDVFPESTLTRMREQVDQANRAGVLWDSPELSSALSLKAAVESTLDKTTRDQFGIDDPLSARGMQAALESSDPYNAASLIALLKSQGRENLLRTLGAQDRIPEQTRAASLLGSLASLEGDDAEFYREYQDFLPSDGWNLLGAPKDEMAAKMLLQAVKEEGPDADIDDLLEILYK